MRYLHALAVFMVVFGASIAGAEAAPCAVNLWYTSSTSSTSSTSMGSDAQTYAIGLKSYVDGAADVRLTLYTAAGAYVAELPHVVLTRPGAVDPGTATSWISDPAYVRLPAGSGHIQAKVLDILDPQTHQPVDCAGNHYAADSLVANRKHFGEQFPVAAAERRKEVERAKASFGPATPVIEATAAVADTQPDCANPYVDAGAPSPFVPGYPALARELQHTGTVDWVVEIGPDGKLLSTNLFRTSGFPELDAAARDAATRSAYTPEVFRCRPIAGSYIFRTDFAGS